ncbi:aminoglycoside adenylyltransferase domain-containing protein [Flexivirga endophytica]|uniref:aminoglycoside adenylyltransferase domain-containing protein n=1 Tax=Flexivirga endophytica TaxID=1849103 RepID=UPI00166CC24A|nr:aminoglycoside adenylyltransferase domain-containing protein [Flexivirga endophytica]
MVLDDVVPWKYPPVCDFLYGEWLRDEFIDGGIPRRRVNPDLAVLIASSRQHAECLRGPHPRDLLDPVPNADLRQSIRDSVEPLLSNFLGDERNVLLTLARMLVTAQTGQIVSKNEAAERVLPLLPSRHRRVLSLASDATWETSSTTGASTNTKRTTRQNTSQP